MSLLSRAIMTLLLTMLVNMAVIVGDRLHRYSLARGQSRVFVHEVKFAFDASDLNSSINLAARCDNGISTLLNPTQGKCFVPQVTHPEFVCQN